MLGSWGDCPASSGSFRPGRGPSHTRPPCTGRPGAPVWQAGPVSALPAAGPACCSRPPALWRRRCPARCPGRGLRGPGREAEPGAWQRRGLWGRDQRVGSGRPTALSPPPRPLGALEGRAALGRLGQGSLWSQAWSQGMWHPGGVGSGGAKGSTWHLPSHTHRGTHAESHTDRLTDTDTCGPAGRASTCRGRCAWSEWRSRHRTSPVPSPSSHPAPRRCWGREGGGSSVRAVSTEPGRAVSESPAFVVDADWQAGRTIVRDKSRREWGQAAGPQPPGADSALPARRPPSAAQGGGDLGPPSSSWPCLAP